MYVAAGKIDYDIRNGLFIGDNHLTLAFILEWIYVARGNVEDHVRNEYFIPGVGLVTAFSGE